MAKRLKELTIRDKIKFGRHQVKDENPEPIIWRLVAKDHDCTPAYPENSVTLHTEVVIDIRAFDAIEVTNPDSFRTTKGNNRYLHSNIFQWLNSKSAAGQWYTAKHEYDSPPDSASVCNNVDTYYSQRAGFLFNFSEKEYDSIPLSTIRTVRNTTIDGGGYDDVESKVFLASKTEVGFANENSIAEGALWEAYSDEASRSTTLAEQCLTNTLATNKPYDTLSGMTYLLRTPTSNSTMFLSQVNPSGGLGSSYANNGNAGIRPALNLFGDTLVSDTVDADGCYTVIFDDPPAITAAPSGDLGVQDTPLKQNYTVTDPDGDSLTIIEKVNGEVIRTLTNQSSGTHLTLDLSPQWQTLDLNETHTAAIEVTDSILTITHEWTFTRSNAAPSIMIEGSSNLGKLAIPLQKEYTISDPNEDALTVIEKLDGQTLRTLPTQPSETKLTFDLTEQWAALSKDSSHTATIEVSDNLLTATHSWEFSVIDPIEQHITSDQSVALPTSVIIPLLPVQVLVTNNANDLNPVWEDASKEYLERKQYGFKNTTKTAEEWCVGVKYTVNGVTIPVKLTTIHEYNFS